MPSLKPIAFHNDIAFVWGCTECSAIFDVGRIVHSGLDRTETEKINQAFREHSAGVHPRSAVIGLPTQTEDGSQAAALPGS